MIKSDFLVYQKNVMNEVKKFTIIKKVIKYVQAKKHFMLKIVKKIL